MNTISNFVSGKLAAIMVVLFSLTMSASVAQARDYYGAISYSQVTGAHGYSYDYGNQAAAQNRAVNECIGAGGTDCVVSTWFRNACGALAVGTGNGWGSHWGNNRNGAEYNAMQACNRNARNCQIVRWVCTTRQ